MANDDELTFTRGEVRDLLNALDHAAFMLTEINKAALDADDTTSNVHTAILHIILDTIGILHVEDVAAMVRDRLWPDDGRI